MAEELESSWFNLKNYEKLNELDLIGWHRQIQIRSLLLYFESEILESGLKPWIDRIKANPILEKYSPKDDDPGYYSSYVMTPKGESSVCYTRAYDFWSIVNDESLDNVWACCALSDECGELDSDQEELVGGAVSLLTRNSFYDDYFRPDTYLTIDTEATDEQITNDFKNWLDKYRKVNGCKLPKNNFTDKDFIDWVKWRLLPYIDLCIITKSEGKEITQPKAAKLIFGDDSSDVDIVDRLRRTTKPKATQLFTEHIVRTLERQINCMAPKN